MILRLLMRFLKKIMGKKPANLTECSKKELLKRIEEVMTRIWGNLPNDILDWKLDNYRIWLSEPFLSLEYEEYDDREQI